MGMNDGKEIVLPETINIRVLRCEPVQVTTTQWVVVLEVQDLANGRNTEVLARSNYDASSAQETAIQDACKRLDIHMTDYVKPETKEADEEDI